MEKPFHFAIMSYSSAIEDMLRDIPPSPEYRIEYLPLLYEKRGMGVIEAIEKGAYDICLLYSSYAYTAVECVGNRVVDINKSDMDRARALLVAREWSNIIGLPLHERDVADVPLLEQLCQVKIRKFVYSGVSELKEVVKKAIDEGIEVFIGGGIVASFCQVLGVRCQLIIPDLRSLQEAISKAVSIARVRRERRKKQRQLLDIFTLLNEGVAYIDSSMNVSWYNQSMLRLLDVKAQIYGEDTLKAVAEKLTPLFEKVGVGETMRSGQAQLDRLLSLKDKELLCNAMPVSSSPKEHGVALFIRDINAIHDIAGRVRAAQRVQSGFVAHANIEHILGVAPCIQRMKEMILQYAPHDAPVLIYGETGTGKDLVAQALHSSSKRSDASFVAINCAALPESLLESELFGYEEGAFTGARKGGKPGLFELAHTGTVFLDEIGELSMGTQLRLLRVLENKEIIRIGGSKVIPVDIRIISASHKSLPELVRKGKFRADLYYRLAGLKIQTPPLRARVSDIPVLLAAQIRKHDKDPSCFTPRIMSALNSYAWPGNIRELRAIAESYLIMLNDWPYDEELFFELFSEWEKDGIGEEKKRRETLSFDGTMKEILDAARRVAVETALERCEFNKSKAAKRLGITYNTLWRILADEGEEEHPEEDGFPVPPLRKKS